MIRVPASVPFFLVSSFLCAAADGQPLTCFAAPSSVPIVRTNGIAERVGDILVVCMGGDPAQSSVVNFQVFLNTDITSRVLNKDLPHPAAEAILLVDDPGSPMSTVPVIPCPASQMLLSTCPAGTNAYQGVYAGAPNTVTWTGIPMMPPGDGPPRIFRIVNLRSNVTQLPPSGFIPSTVAATVAASGSIPVTIDNSQVTVGFAQPALNWSLRTVDNTATLSPGGLQFRQCVANNAGLALDPSSSSAPEGVSFLVRVSENFGTAILKQSTYSAAPANTEVRPPYMPQNFPGFPYNVENGFVDPAYPATDNMSAAGVASQATRFVVRFSGPRGGLQIHAPAWELGRDATTSRVRLVAAEPVGLLSLQLPYVPLGPSSLALGSYYNQDTVYVYEVTASGDTSPFMMENIDLAFTVAHTGRPYVTTGATSVSVNLSPISNVTAATPLDWLPRFKDSGEWQTVATLNPCPAQPKLAASISAKSGTAAARVWSVKLSNTGPGAATNARITGLALTQTYGAACTPVVQTSFPTGAGDLASGAAVLRNLTIDFTGCPNLARFTAKLLFAADDTVAGSTTYYNQFR